MKKISKNKSGMSVGKVATIGAGVATVGAGAYYFLGPKGKQHRGKAKAWMVEMEMEIEKKLKKAKNITELFYHGAVDTMATIYSKQYKEYAGEITTFADKLKGEWKSIQHKTRPVITVIKKTKITDK